MNVNQLGIALIFSGASGTGKSTVSNIVRATLPETRFSISCTTRAPRGEEKNGVDYYFLTREEFKAKLAEDAFIEYAEVHGNFYGTLKSEVLKYVENGEDVLLDIDVQGAQKIRESAQKHDILARCVETIFIAPPSFEELERRLRGRGTDSEEVIARRLENAKNELSCWQAYDYLLVNDDVQVCAENFLGLIRALHLKTKRMKEPLA